MVTLYQDTCRDCAALITRRYSTSFSMGIRAFSKELRGPIYSIYGFVRFADEIVDTFHEHDRAALLNRFREDTWQALRDGISLNPVLQAFQEVVHRYRIDHALIASFLDSMAMDLIQDSHERASYDTYIYGSAEVVGLMCLCVFVDGDEVEYQRLKEPARRLGAAFQKINFLRDMQSDFEDRGRIYFPGVDFLRFTKEDKRKIEQEVDADFKAALVGIIELPASSRFGVYLAYRFYYRLFKKLCGCTPEHVLQNRVRVSNVRKFFLIFDTWLQSRLRLFVQ